LFSKSNPRYRLFSRSKTGINALQEMRIAHQWDAINEETKTHLQNPVLKKQLTYRFFKLYIAE